MTEREVWLYGCENRLTQTRRPLQWYQSCNCKWIFNEIISEPALPAVTQLSSYNPCIDRERERCTEPTSEYFSLSEPIISLLLSAIMDACLVSTKTSKGTMKIYCTFHKVTNVRVFKGHPLKWLFCCFCYPKMKNSTRTTHWGYFCGVCVWTSVPHWSHVTHQTESQQLGD